MHFTITSDEGLPIRGNIQTPASVTPRAIAVIVHGFKGFKDWGFFPWLAESLCDSGVLAVRFNMSRSGIGEKPETFDRLDLFAEDTYTTQVADLRAVVHHVHRQMPHLPIFLVGHSRGGGVALLGAHDVPQLKGVVTWSAISHAGRWDETTVAKWRADGAMDVINQRTGQNMRMSTAILDDFDAHREELDICSAASRLRVPLLVIHGERDESVPVAEAREIASRLHDVSLAVIANASHTYNAIHPLVSVPQELELAATLTQHFIKAYA